jgi:ComF family protein
VRLKNAISDVVHFIYPPHCIVCGQPGQESEPAFCASCEAELNVISAEPACDVCAAPLPAGSSCPYCSGEGIFPFEKIVALGPFRKSLRKLIHQMKYHHRWPIAEILAERLCREKRVVDLLDQTDVLVPVSLFWSRQIGRGYNQADALAARLSQIRKIPLVHPIIRVKNTSPQTLRPTRAERIENLRDAFGLIDAKSIAHKRVTLVDDVLTTAATLKSAASAMKPAKPESICAIVIATADPRRRDFQTV